MIRTVSGELNYLYYDRVSYQFQEVITTFEHLTGLKICILFKTHYDKEKTHRDKAFLERIGHFSNYCTLIKSSKKVKGCNGYDGIERARKAETLQRPFIDECPSGVIELIVPLIIKGNFIATIFCGAVCKYIDKKKGFEDIWKRVSYRGINKEKLNNAYQSFVYTTKSRLLEYGNFLFYALSHIGRYIDDSAIEKQIQLQKNPIINKSVILIQNSREEFPTAGELANYFNITPAYFSKLFKRVMKINFIDYLIELRILRAQELLTNTMLPIIDIAYEVGYQRQSYFTKKFHELTGVTPRKFRSASSLLMADRKKAGNNVPSL